LSILGAFYKTTAGGGVWDLLASYTSSGTDTSATLTFTAEQEDYTMLMVVGAGASSDALDLTMELSGKTGDYYYDYITNIATTLLGVDGGAQANWVIIPSSLLGGSYHFGFVAYIYLSGVATTLNMNWQGGGQLSGNVSGTGLQNGFNAEPVTQILMKVSTSSWKDNTRFKVYGLKV